MKKTTIETTEVVTTEHQEEEVEEEVENAEEQEAEAEAEPEEVEKAEEGETQVKKEEEEVVIDTQINHYSICCPGCKAIPQVTVDPKENKIHIECTNPECTNKEKDFPIDKYIECMKKALTENDYCELNKDHTGKIAIERCETCQANLCPECVKIHQKLKITDGHKTEKLEKNKDKIRFYACEKHDYEPFTSYSTGNGKNLCPKDVAEINTPAPLNMTRSTTKSRGAKNPLRDSKQGFGEVLNLKDLLKDVESNNKLLQDKVEGFANYCYKDVLAKKEELIKFLKGLIEKLNSEYVSFTGKNKNLLEVVSAIASDLSEATPIYQHIQNLKDHYNLGLLKFDYQGEGKHQKLVFENIPEEDKKETEEDKKETLKETIKGKLLNRSGKKEEKKEEEVVDEYAPKSVKDKLAQILEFLKYLGEEQFTFSK